MPEQIERLARTINSEVATFDKTALSSLSVVIRPTPNTELNVEFRREQGQIEVRIRCDHGDQERWQRHWPELQSLLAEKSIRLLPLEEQRAAASDRAHTAQSDSSAHGDKHSQPRHPDHPSTTNRRSISNPGNFAPLLTPASEGRALHHGFETWA